MTQAEDFNAVLQELAVAIDPLSDAANLWVETEYRLDTVTSEDIETVGQAILATLVSLNMALEGLVKLVAPQPVTLGDLVE